MSVVFSGSQPRTPQGTAQQAPAGPGSTQHKWDWQDRVGAGLLITLATAMLVAWLWASWPIFRRRR